MRSVLRAKPPRKRSGWSWGFVGQGFAAATSFGLSVFAGRAIGPGGLGIVMIGFYAYLAVLIFQRSLLGTPLVTLAAPRHSNERRAIYPLALTIQLIGGLGMTSLFLLCGLVFPGPVGRGLLLFAPWMLPALLQNFWRGVLWTERRARAAAFNDCLWAVVMGAAIPLVWLAPTDWTIVCSWGTGALAGSLLGFMQTRVRPAKPKAALDWWRVEIWPYGRWLVMEGAVYATLTSAAILILAGILGAAALGGLRAAQTLFAPLTFVIPAISLPGLPALVRALNRPQPKGLTMAAHLSAAVTGIAALYVTTMALVGATLLSFVFGHSFAPFANLVWPIAAWQLSLAVGVGFDLLLRANKNGRAIVIERTVGSVGSFALICGLGWGFGVSGAAWGFAGGAAAATCAAIAFTLRPSLGLRSHSQTAVCAGIAKDAVPAAAHAPLDLTERIAAASGRGHR